MSESFYDSFFFFFFFFFFVAAWNKGFTFMLQVS